MKRMAFLTISLIAMETAARSAWAADSAGTYQSNMLVLLFLGVCALIVVAQLVPALILMMATISGFVKRIAGRKHVVMASANRDETA